MVGLANNMEKEMTFLNEVWKSFLDSLTSPQRNQQRLVVFFGLLFMASTVASLASFFLAIVAHFGWGILGVAIFAVIAIFSFHAAEVVSRNVD